MGEAEVAVHRCRVAMEEAEESLFDGAHAAARGTDEAFAAEEVDGIFAIEWDAVVGCGER